MNVTNLFHFFNIISKLKNINKNKLIKNININFKNTNVNKLSKTKKTLFVCSHDYCFADIISIAQSQNIIMIQIIVNLSHEESIEVIDVLEVEGSKISKIRAYKG